MNAGEPVLVYNLLMGAHFAAAVNCFKTDSKWFEVKIIGIT
jgi:hypothetical protein